MPKFYLTTAIDYSNGDPHLGHALEKIGADCIARYRRLRGDDVRFLMGMDEHSQSVIQAAARAGVTPQAWVDRMAVSFADYWRRLECSNDDWIRTTEPRHARAVTALLGRIRARHPDDLFEAEYERLWPADLHVIGKGITRFHCVIWPAMLLAAELAPPRAVWAHGYVQWSGAKMSKTAGTAVTLGEAIDHYGPDALRYYLLREVGFANDGDFTWERFDARYESDLANTFGNLVKRSLDMIHSFRGGIVPRDPRTRAAPLEDAARTAVAAYQRAMDGYELEEGAAQWMDLAARANRYIQETVPWELRKAGKETELDAVLAGLARTVARLAVLCQPFIPATADAVWTLFGPPTPLARVRLADLGEPAVEGRPVAKPPILFPKSRLASA